MKFDFHRGWVHMKMCAHSLQGTQVASALGSWKEEPLTQRWGSPRFHPPTSSL